MTITGNQVDLTKIWLDDCWKYGVVLVLVSKDLTINILFSSRAAKIKLSKCCQACSGLTSEIQSTSVAFQLFLYARYTVLVLLPLVKLEILILINAMHVTLFSRWKKSSTLMQGYHGTKLWIKFVLRDWCQSMAKTPFLS